jgi:hypothetical protein
MSRKGLLSLLAAACMMLPAVVRGGTSTDTVTVNGTVAAFAEWSAATNTINIATPISSVSVAQTGSVNLTLYANATTSISAAGGTHAGILTNGAYTLTTKYKLTGVGLAAPDAAYKLADSANAGEFFHSGNTYAIDYQAGTGSYAVTLSVQMSAPPGAAPESGSYSCDVVLTATF